MIAGQVAPEARETLEAQGVLVLALSDRVWQASETFTRAALLVKRGSTQPRKNYEEFAYVAMLMWVIRM